MNKDAKEEMNSALTKENHNGVIKWIEYVKINSLLNLYMKVNSIYNLHYP